MQDLRIRHADDADKFLKSEVDLDEEVRKIQQLAAAPELSGPSKLAHRFGGCFVNFRVSKKTRTKGKHEKFSSIFDGNLRIFNEYL